MQQPDGLISQIGMSLGGVPKLPVPRARVTVLGLDGDAQNDTRHHGGPERALCLYSLERIQALQTEGHPVMPGAVGENLTLSGLDWERIQPGVRLRLGSQVQVEITSFTVPCNTIAEAFLENKYGRISQTQHPGWSRAYVRVLQEGEIQSGDPVWIL
jgi:MOSC domain-containing protein YiiM